MNINNFQKEMFNRLLRGERVIYTEDNGMVLLSDGYRAYAFYEKEILLDLTKCFKADLTDVLRFKENDTRLEETNKLYASGDRICVSFKTEDGTEIWVQQKLLSGLRDCQFYGNSPTDRIIACNMHKRPVAVVLPMRIAHD